jgi:SAM-dependent methyltransferase
MSITTEASEETTQEALKYPGLQQQTDDGKSRGPLFRAIRRFLRSQFGRPTGFWGSIAGRIMARSASNNDRSRWTISLLDIQRHDRLLEIGFGPGIAIELATKMATEGFIAGIDHSEVMVRQAAKRNAAAIREGKVELYLGSASKLPTFDQPFDKIFTINSIHFWADPIDRLKELRALLRPGGMIAVVIQPRSRSATDATTRLVGEELVANLQRAGFVNCRLEIKQIAPVSVACAIGIN